MQIGNLIFNWKNGKKNRLYTFKELNLYKKKEKL